MVDENINKERNRRGESDDERSLYSDGLHLQWDSRRGLLLIIDSDSSRGRRTRGGRGFRGGAMLAALGFGVPNATTSQSMQQQFFNIAWNPSEEEWIILKTNGSFIASSGEATCGGAIRGNFGAFMEAFSVKLGSCSIMHVEL
ncbi:hypothetical protein RIF29_24884 [Crotalaria pallida]|uniref:Uncharacterized protein n=1 Tax=Crotalaria pallida TaxID=3830 RepID=A0AAN9HYT8_CROPI